MGESILATSGVTKRFDGLVAVDDITYQVSEGETAGIIGPNGAGKSTFFNLLTGYFRPSEGQVHFKGRDITKRPSYERVMMGIARTFQLVSVFDSMSVMENMMLARVRQGQDYKSKTRFFFKNAHYRGLEKECADALDTLGIADKADALTGDMGYGEKRELEIAIALSLNPKILLLDEPFAGLSLVDIAHISEVIKKIKGQFTIVIIEHKISKLMDLVESLCVINEGALVCNGNPQEVICDAKVKECYWGKEDMVCY
ncbi:MAG: ABC transporter ATP-binding protein [Desulfarculaceae bacterium]|nr:ABC transporter ATP-binding protein [Desulfarculaceae bacterium]MCF8074428.1 ABC transporter ATP-binding protein [Desulfarculaceae bacterium]MCF8102732.1 ABC transporter ATP-binding protein [Desulfarculaceae bacterium]MCF8116413.1 ABC transporter ATP-binding protein [Desulfarculaceae bacterium]